MAEATRWVLANMAGSTPVSIITEVAWDGVSEIGLPDGQKMISPAAAAGLPMARPEPPPSRVVTAMGFRALLTDAERNAMRAADPRLADAELMAMAQNAVNLDSPRTASLMALAVAKGAVTRVRADAVLAGLLP